jgi:hypothetical protein
MKALLLLPLLLMIVSPGQNPITSPQTSAVTVLSFKWFRTRQNVKAPDPSATGPAAPVAEMIAPNKNYQKNARANDPAGAIDPNEGTIDGRSAALEKSVQESRAPKGKPTDGFAYLVKVQNASPKVIESLFLELQFVDRSNPASVTRRQFLCDVKIKPDKERELQAFSVSGPSDVISVKSLANATENPFQEKVVINRVEYEDGSTWQRKDWNALEIKLAYKRVISTPWDPGEMCRQL